MRFTSSWPHETVLPTRNAECLPTRDRRFLLAHPRMHHPARGADPGRGSLLMPSLSTLTPVRLETILQKIQLMRGIPVERDMSGKIGRSEKFRAGKELRKAGSHRVSRTRATIAAYWQASSRMRVKSPVAIAVSRRMCKVPRGLKPRGFPDDPSPRFRGGIQARVSSSGVLTCRLCRVSRRGCVVSILRSPRLVSWGSSPGVPDPWYWLTFYAGSLPVPATAYVRRLDRTGNGPVIKDRLFLSTFVGAASSTALERAWHPPRFIGEDGWQCLVKSQPRG